MRSDTEAIIKVEIEHVFGSRIVSSRDCIHLSDEIFHKTKFKLNPNTLRRFFGLVKSKYPPSRATLNILCNYCGFRSIDEVQVLHAQQNGEPGGSIHAEAVLNYLVTLFNELPVGNDPEKTFYHLVRHTIDFLNRNSSMIEKFQRLIVKTKHGKEFYFEQFINIDSLGAFYGDGLRYYLLEKESPEAQVFAHALLVFRYWLSGDAQKLQSHFNEMIRHRPDVAACPVLHGFYYAAWLFHAHVKEVSPAATIADIHHYHLLEIPIHGSVYRFEAIVAEALVLTGNYEEGLYFTNYQLRKYADDEHTEAHLLQNAYLFNAIALYHTGDAVNAARMIRKIRPSQFYFLAKKYQAILYGLLNSRINRKQPHTYEDQVGALIEQTGFTRMSALF